MFISGLKNIYPQLFVHVPKYDHDNDKNHTSTTMYWGTYQRLLESYNTNTTTSSNNDGNDNDQKTTLHHQFLSGCTNRP